MEQNKGNNILMCARYILKVRPEGFSEGLHVGCEIREEARMTQYFVLRDWTDGIVISSDEKDCGRGRHGERRQGVQSEATISLR